MSKGKKKKSVSLATKKARMGWVFVSPFVLGFFLFYVVIIAESIEYSFMDVKTLPEGGFSTTFVGWSNYNYMTRVITYFTSGMWATVRDMLYSLPILLLFSLFVAVILNQKLKGRGLFRAIFFVPVILSTGIIAKSDAVNNVVSAFSTMDTGSMTTVAEEATSAFSVDGLMYYIKDMFNFAPWLLEFIESAATNVYAVISKSGVQILIFLAGLQSISPSLYEAAKMEGCSSWESFWKITLPMISPMILVNLIYSIVDCFTRYDNSVMNTIQQMITSTDYGYASAAAWIYFCVIALLVLIIFGVASRFVFYQGKER